MVQRAVAMRLEAISEQDFHDGSDGFRRGRSPHHARHELRERCMREGLSGMVDADMRGDFDRMDWTQWRAVLGHRVKDGRMRRLMGKWLRAGVMEDGVLTHPETGVVQGGVLSPMFANLCLPHGLDEWCAREVRPRRKGRGVLIRCADDFVIGCEREGDARKIMAVLPKRFARYGLRMHPTKTTLIAFKKPDAYQASANGNGTFDFRGFTHDWTQSRRGFLGSQA
jgi:RNA-directed DNA polymerase